jgi:hypothetical protein
VDGARSSLLGQDLSIVVADLLDPSSGAGGGGLNLRHLGRLWWTSWDGGQYPPVRESDLDASSLPPL